MAVRIKFDNTHNVIQPTLVLATRNGRKLGNIPAYNIVFKDGMNECSEMSFNVNKADCVSDIINSDFWKSLADFKLMWVREWDKWFEIYVELDESNDTVKKISAKSLGEAELSQINLYDIEINTENDILRDDYEPTVLFNKTNSNASLLSRILVKAPHYKIHHVDDSIANIQRTFTFNGKSIYDAFLEVAEEIDCLFVINCHSDSDGNVVREVNVYDLESYCSECGERGTFDTACEKCGSKHIEHGYGEDTTIFISTENLADNIKYSTNNGSVKNCFKLEAGDDLMTATLVNCNPNGSGYIWYISDSTKEDMSDNLVQRLNGYDESYEYYQKEHQSQIDPNVLTAYNNLIEKYTLYSSDYKKISSPIVGYPALMKAYYNTVDFYLYLNNNLMPSVEIQKTTAALQAAKLNYENLSPVAVNNINVCSAATAENAVLAMAKAIIDSRYQVKIADSTFDDKVWSGIFIITNYSDEEDTVTSNRVTCEINDDYENYVKQKIYKTLNKTVADNDATDIIQLFDLTLEEFKKELKKYSLSRLSSFHDSCQSCLDILIEQGIANNETWANKNPNLYIQLYVPYYNKLGAIEAEMKLRESEIAIIIGIYDKDNNLVSEGIQTLLNSEKDSIQEALNFEKYLGEELWLEFAAYRREDTYSNDNYISDGLDNSELFQTALEFIETAKKDIFKSATLQHSISATLKNLLAIKEFEPIVKYFEVGNWLRVRVDDNIYRLRLLNYEIDFDNLENISITFSDVTVVSNGTSDIKSILNQASSMATSYSTVSRQASQGIKSQDTLKDWLNNGLDAAKTKIICGINGQTQTWDEHGLLFRRFDSILDSYDDIQMKIVNSTLAITNDNWKTTKTAIGLFKYDDPVDRIPKESYGINGEAIVGKLFIGENLGIYNRTGSLTFDENGFVVSNGNNIISINPNSSLLFNIKNHDGNVLTFDDNGDLIIVGNITAKSLTLLDGTQINANRINGLSNVAVSGNYSDLINSPNLSSVAISGDYNDLINSPNLSSVAISGEYSDLINKPEYFDILVNNAVAVSGQILMKNDGGSCWVSTAESITESGTNIVNEKAVYNYALPKNLGIENYNSILYISENGDVKPLNISDLKQMLNDMDNASM